MDRNFPHDDGVDQWDGLPVPDRTPSALSQGRDHFLCCFGSFVVLALAILARYAFHLAGPWRKTFVVCAVLALYLNCFVAVVQAFLKGPALIALAPTQQEPPLLVA